MAWTPHKEGDAIALAAVNANIGALETQVNAIGAGAIAPKSLHSAHLPSVIGQALTKKVYGTEQAYTNRYPGWDSDTSVGARYWEVVANSEHGELTFSLADVDLTKHKLLIMANIGIKDIQPTSGTGQTEGRAAVKIQVQDNGHWFGIARTERYLSSKHQSNGDSSTRIRHGEIPIRTLIDSSDIEDTGFGVELSGLVTGVRVVVSVLYGALADAASDSTTLTLLNSNLSAIMIKQAL
tara:strand:- start:5895 stop:6608 length:714 start_codon:yes stop_codon:yes gene_type:complete